MRSRLDIDVGSELFMRRISALFLVCFVYAGCASNIKDTDLLASNSVMLPPPSGKTIFLQNRNASDNQAVSLNDLESRLMAKGYQIVPTPSAAYVVLTNIVYCNQTKLEMPVEDIVASGYGSGAGSSVMSGLQSLSGMASMAGPHGALAGSAASMGLTAAQGIGNAVGSMFSGPSRHAANENISYACVVDVQITDRAGAGDQMPQVQPGMPPPMGVYQTRLAASVHQKSLDEQEATPLVQQRLSAAVAGHF